MAKADLTPERLRELLHYDPDTGLFTWKAKPSVKAGRTKIGAVAGTKLKNGRLMIGISGGRYYAHHLAWFYTHGRWPRDGLDHRDGNPMNNRIDNLREATQAQNMQNLSSTPGKRNKSGFVGASCAARDNAWLAHIKVNGKNTYLGTFPTPELAHVAYCKAKAKHHSFQPVLRD